jgi:hypothetical protein
MSSKEKAEKSKELQKQDALLIEIRDEVKCLREKHEAYIGVSECWSQVCDVLDTTSGGWRDIYRNLGQAAYEAIKRMHNELEMAKDMIDRLRNEKEEILPLSLDSKQLRKASYDALNQFADTRHGVKMGASEKTIRRYAKENYGPEPEHITSVIDRINKADSEADVLRIMRETVTARGDL